MTFTAGVELEIQACPIQAETVSYNGQFIMFYVIGTMVRNLQRQPYCRFPNCKALRMFATSRLIDATGV